MAASQTTSGRTPHSAHVYYLRAGDARLPVDFHVERARDGGTLSTRQVTARQRLLLKTFQAEIVGAPLQQGQTPLVFQRFRHRGQIAAVELILQRLRTGGNNHLLLRAQRRSKVSIRFTRAGSGFDHQRLSLIDGACNGVRHLALRFTRFKAGYRLRKLAVCCKIVRHVTPWKNSQ